MFLLATGVRPTNRNPEDLEMETTRNFFVVETSNMEAGICYLPCHLREGNQLPSLSIYFKEAGWSFKTLLSPESRDVMRAFLPTAEYLPTGNTNLLPLLDSFVKGRERLREGRTGFGNPMLELAEHFGAMDVEGLNRFFRLVHHILRNIALKAEELVELYQDLRHTLGYLEGVGLKMYSIEEPGPGLSDIPHHLQEMDNAGKIGYPLARVVHLAEFEDPILELLRFALNRPELGLRWLESGEEECREGAREKWETHFGAMWGPFK